MRGITVENAAHLYDRAREVDLLAKDLRAIWRREDGPADIQAHFAAVNVESRHYLDVARSIWANFAVHEANTIPIGGGALIKVYSLDKRTGAVPHSDNSDSDLSHSGKKATLPGAKLFGQEGSYVCLL